MSRYELEWIEPLLWDAPYPVIRLIYHDAKMVTGSRRGSMGRVAICDVDISARASYLRAIRVEFNRRLIVLDIMVEGVTW